MSNLTRFEELVLVKGAMELDFVAAEKIQECLETIFQQPLQDSQAATLLKVILQKEYLTQSQVDFLSEGVEEDRLSNKLPKIIDINNPNAVQTFLGVKATSGTQSAPATVKVKAHAVTPPAIETTAPARSGTASDTKETTTKASNGDKTSRTTIVECPYCHAKFRVKSPLNSNKFKCGKCREYFFVHATPVIEHKSQPVKSDSQPVKNETVNLSQTQVLEIQETLRVQKDAVPQPESTSPLWSSDTVDASQTQTTPQESPSVQAPTRAQAENQAEEFAKALWSSSETNTNDTPQENQTDPASQPLWSSDAVAATEIKAQEATAEAFSQALWSSDGEGLTASTSASPQNSEVTSPLSLGKTVASPLDVNVASPLDVKEEPASSTAETLQIDFLKLPEQDISASDILNISVAPASVESAGMKTMELDIRSLNLFKQKREKLDEAKLKELQELTKNISQPEGAVVVKYAMSYGLVSKVEVENILDKYYQELFQGHATETLATLLLTEGYITKSQFATLQESLDKDKKAKRIPALDMASRQEVERFLNISEDKKAVKITCPHCKATFRACVSDKGGKFRCGKCSKSFFLSQKK